MANWSKSAIRVPKYSWTSSNQHGNRYKRAAVKELNICRITAEITSAHDLKDLILLSHHLDVPVHYNFNTDPQTAYIEIVSAEKLRQAIY